MYTKKEREYYNAQRNNACKRLGITINQYNWLRREGQKLHKIYEDNCNGIIDSEAQYNVLTSRIESKIRQYLINQKLYAKNKRVYHVFFQTDPRGETIYIDNQPIPSNNYTQAVCIY